ncbi:NO-inducible flavohemoprotein [Alicyclobacillus fastidiosus]|uniref:Flavohemoprotein n=1 Tax=Alicyclobacillus fastidiosus TaxID=392011 RepID=A0ABY6ZNF0_9BACL|nr:NO-inducible flavohemoprotein [Alicyclobacillus fastidiosus]WAH44503.1 NO-inducible flavohemoprotein [Alicyclobacillus fastidiosus]
MLDAKTVEIVKLTAPVLKEHSHDIGHRFYELLFSKVPELNNMFNQTNQKRGLQQDALAYAVYEAGANIEHLDAIKPMVHRITQKHRALGVKAEHYPVVGGTLLAAVKDVLGAAATDEIIDAWGRTYSYIADIFISAEQGLYDEMEHKQGGWIGVRNFVVDRKIKESDVITSFYLKPEDGKPIASYEAGQYITVWLDIPGEKYTHVRHYSLSEAPGKDFYRISVKREEGRANVPSGIVSTYIHDHVDEGSHLKVSAPAGDFTIYTKNTPIVLISGGVGITPMISMLNTIVETQPERQVTFIHAAMNSKVHAMKEHIGKLARQHERVKSFVCYESPTEQDRAEHNYDKEGFVTLEWLSSVIDDKQADFYVCGPLPFMRVVLRALKDMEIPDDRSHYESFSPVGILEEA